MLFDFFNRNQPSPTDIESATQAEIRRLAHEAQKYKEIPKYLLPSQYSMEITLVSQITGSRIGIIWITYWGKKIAFIDHRGLSWKSWFLKNKHADLLEPYLLQNLQNLEKTMGRVSNLMSETLSPTQILKFVKSEKEKENTEISHKGEGVISLDAYRKKQMINHRF